MADNEWLKEYSENIQEVRDFMTSEDWKDCMELYIKEWKNPTTEFHVASVTCLMIKCGVPIEQALYYTMSITHALHQDLADGA